MILIEKSLHPESGLKFNVKTVNEAKPPPEFRQHGEDFAYSHPDEIIEYIDRTFPLPSLKSDSAGAGDATANLFRAFAFFIKECEQLRKNGLVRLQCNIEEVFERKALDEIILYWADRPDTPNLSSQKRSQLYRQKTTCTLTVPSETENGARENGEN
uniref:Decapping nuclease n=1 Tax=Parascaris equorum TaxID=6256 RepID=A0A914SFJ9_PAREQ